MKKIQVLAIWVLSFLLLCTACSSKTQTQNSASSVEPPYISGSIAFGENAYYAVAYLGYNEMPDLAYYTQTYVGKENLPIHYVSQGDYYLVIPRYRDMAFQLYKNDIETNASTLIYESAQSEPFVVQCNISDIFSDVTISYTYQSQTYTFSPFISLKDGSVQVGENGVNITRQ